jgi:MSHA biogenesis protein MshQ
MTELEGTPLEVPDTVNTVVWDNLDTNYPNDDDKQVIVLDFPFQFDSVSYPALTIFTNGIIKFLPTERMHRVFSNNSLPTSSGDNFLAVYWDDLVDDASSSVTYGTLGTAPNRKFIVNWSNVRSYAGNLRYDFQVVLYENGDIRYRYNNNTSNGQSATIGLEINDADFIQYSYNSVSVESVLIYFSVTNY